VLTADRRAEASDRPGGVESVDGGPSVAGGRWLRCRRGACIRVVCTRTSTAGSGWRDPYAYVAEVASRRGGLAAFVDPGLRYDVLLRVAPAARGTGRVNFAWPVKQLQPRGARGVCHVRSTHVGVRAFGSGLFHQLTLIW
jgi:hypothetical protein